MNQKEQQRVMVLNRVERGEVTGKEAAGLMGLTVRQVRRLLAAYRKEGVAAIAHGNRGRRPVHGVAEEVRTLVVALAQGPYARLNHYHLTELLVEREGLSLCRSTVRRILLVAGMRSPRRRRPLRHRCRRERYPQEGMLLQIDGSRHDWLEGRGPHLTLVGGIDDATGTVPYALFREQEDAQGYFLLLREVIRSKGVPLALYSDRHGIFQRSPRETESLEEQLAGERQPTQFGRALRDLGIQPIFALSPQAKGRVERLFGTLQDRLVSELRMAGASTVEQANRVLEAFLPCFNAHFGVPAAQPGSAYRSLPPEVELEGVLCFKYVRTVAKDNTVRFGGHTLQLLPGLDRPSYARVRVEVQERLDGSLAVAYQGRVLATREAPPHPVVLRARKGTRSQPPAPSSLKVGACSPLEEARRQAGNKGNGHKPGLDHPWRRYPVVTISLNR
ncbi:MAG: ISNCY family transposase [Dehalococcoidia bacterium]